MSIPCSLIPRLLTPFQRFTRKLREPGKTHHVSNVAGRTDLLSSSGTKSSRFHPLRHSRDKFFQALSCNIEKLEGVWIGG